MWFLWLSVRAGALMCLHRITGVSRSGPSRVLAGVCRVAIVRGSAAKRLIVNRSALAHASVRAGSASAVANARPAWRNVRDRLWVEAFGDFHGDFSGISDHNSHETVSTYELGRARAWAERLRVRRVVRMYAQHRSMRPSTLAVAAPVAREKVVRVHGRYRPVWSPCCFGAPAGVSTQSVSRQLLCDLG